MSANLEPSPKRELYPISSKVVAQATSAAPNFKYGIGYDHGNFTTLETLGNYNYQRGVFLNQTRVPIITVSDNNTMITPPAFAAFVKNKEIPSKMNSKLGNYEGGPGYCTMKTGNYSSLEKVRNPMLGNTKDNFFSQMHRQQGFST